MSHPLLLATCTNRQAAALVLTGALATFSGLVVSGVGIFVAIIAALFFAPLFLNAWIDAATQKLVKRFTHCSGVVALAALVTQAISPWRAGLLALGIAVALTVPLGLMSHFSAGKLMGFGDVRLIFVLLLWNGLWSPTSALLMLAASFFFHTLAVLVWSIWGLTSVRRSHALGPWLIGAAWICTLIESAI
ncbi:MAG: hypothetical protein Q4E03_04255 [Trueperella sp.]|nr:hypothetical protein [Trueperella sp.]